VNFVIIMLDTFRADHLGYFGNGWIHTPHLDNFAERATSFERARAASYPTVPNRLDLFSGCYGEPLHAWQPLPWDMVTLPEVMRHHGYVTQLICDTPHLINYGFGFDRPFHAWQMIRGNEVDRYMTAPEYAPLNCAPNKLAREQLETFLAQYLRNIASRRVEEDWFAPQVMTAASNWLQHNYKHEKFFLWVDCFDPHEPWDPPKHYVDMYNPGYTGNDIIFYAAHRDKTVHPKLKHIGAHWGDSEYDPANDMTPEEFKQLGALYAGKCTMVDRWVGHVLETIDVLGIADTTAIFIMSDHGTHVGTRGKITKTDPVWQEIGRILVLVRHPDIGRGLKSDALVQPPDVMPTVLEMAGITDYEGPVQGRSLVPIMKGESGALRKYAFTGYAPTEFAGSTSIVASSRDWVYGYYPGVPDANALYNIKDDPAQQKNVVGDHPDVAEQHRQAILEFAREHGMPERVYQAYEQNRYLEPLPESQLPAWVIGLRKRGLSTRNMLRHEFS
jgi:arylsulfatase A-like enzyme